MDTDRQDDDALEAMFAQARAAGPDAALRARVLADADRVQAELAAMTPAAPPRRGWIIGLVSAVGGWGAASGITAAGALGLMIGFAVPDTLELWLGSGALPASLSSDYGVTPDLSALWVEVGDV
ncbi:hypothetical protein V8J82_13860 [Gymnodinialimonas sp. 2305UL16-5]|uniref:hypothetical protein n=1 Tax=Gymnodinialimonas mytili TaxID=3126503 RepID=UPI00309EA0D6